MAQKKARPAGRSTAAGRTSRSRTSSSRPSRSRTTRGRTTRRRTSTAGTLGTAVGVAIAGLLAALLGGLPWWGWVLLIAVGLVAGAFWAIRRGRAAEAADAAVDADPAVPPSGDGV